MPAFLLQWLSEHGLPALFVLLMLGVFGLPVPDETLLTFTGVLVGQGRIGFVPAWIAAATGSMCGITLSFAIGRTGGRAVLARYGAWLHTTPERIAGVERWMEHSGRLALMFGYYVPGVRHLTAIVAGSTGLPARIFASSAYAGAVVWSLTFIALGWYVGERWEDALAVAHRHLLAALIVIIFGGAAVWLVRRLRRY